MDLKSKTIEYHFEGKKETADYDKTFLGQRTATIIFKTNVNYCLFEFKECKYSGLSEIYTEEDWDFLKEVADKIKELKKKLNK